MEELADTKKMLLTDNNQVRTHLTLNKGTEKTVETNEMVEILRSEGGESLFNYSEWLGVINEPDFIVLSSNHHYYFDDEELSNISTIITIQPLNQIRNLGEFCETIVRLLPNGSKIIGSFSLSRTKYFIHSGNNSAVNGSVAESEALENGIITRNPFLSKIFSFFDSRTNRQMTKDGVTELLRTYGIKTLDMTELNGLIYFCAQKNRVFAE